MTVKNLITCGALNTLTKSLHSVCKHYYILPKQCQALLKQSSMLLFIIFIPYHNRIVTFRINIDLYGTIEIADSICLHDLFKDHVKVNIFAIEYLFAHLIVLFLWHIEQSIVNRGRLLGVTLFSTIDIKITVKRMFKAHVLYSPI